MLKSIEKNEGFEREKIPKDFSQTGDENPNLEYFISI